MTESKPLLTADLIKPIVDAVEQGRTRPEAAAAARGGRSTLLQWLQTGRRARDAGAGFVHVK